MLDHGSLYFPAPLSPSACMLTMYVNRQASKEENSKAASSLLTYLPKILIDISITH